MSNLEFNSKNFVELYRSEQGQKLWQYLNTEHAILKMQTASDLNKPALLGIEKDLLQLGLMEESAKFETNADGEKSPEHKIYDRTKQMLGAMVRQVMEQQNYQLHTKNMRINSKIFYAASLYREIGDQDENEK